MNIDVMNVLINMAPLKSGGGQNVALNFLSMINEISDDNEYFYLVSKNSMIYEFLLSYDETHIVVVSPNQFKRLFFEKFRMKYLIRKFNIDIIYSYFGYGLFPDIVPQISGAADSNLMYMEVDFWKDYRGIPKLIHLLKDQYRIFGLKHAHAIVFENEILEKRYHKLYETNIMTTTIKPSISLHYNKQEFQLSENLRKVKKGLFLCGWHLNKNVLMIPRIAYEFKKMKYPINILLTASYNNSDVSKEFMNLVEFYDVGHYVSLIGEVKKEELESLYKQIDVVYLLSKLESFSNNIIEAWAYNRVLLVSDEEWAHSICHDAAVYVNRDSVEDIVENTIRILNNNDEYNMIVEQGTLNLKTYPSIVERTKMELEFIKKVYESF